LGFFEKIIRLVHPFMPFLSEELYHDELFGERSEIDCCIVAAYPKPGTADNKLIKEMEIVKQVVSEIRNIRNTKQISPKEPLLLSIKVNSDISYQAYTGIISKLANISEVSFSDQKASGAASFLADRDEFFVPLSGNIDVEAERERMTKEL